MDYDLNNRFEGHIVSDEQSILIEGVRHSLKSVAEGWVQNLPEGREKSLALTKLEEAMFWADAAIARSK